MAKEGPRVVWRRLAAFDAVSGACSTVLLVGTPASLQATQVREVPARTGERVRRAFLLNVTRFSSDVRDGRDDPGQIHRPGSELRVARAIGDDILEVEAP